MVFHDPTGERSAALADAAAAEGVAGVAVCAMHADRVIDLAEEQSLALHLARMRIFHVFEDDDVDALVAGLHDLAMELGHETLLDWCAQAVPPSLRNTAYFVATDIVLSDGNISAMERAFLGRARDALGIDIATAGKILDVLAIKHSG